MVQIVYREDIMIKKYLFLMVGAVIVFSLMLSACAGFETCDYCGGLAKSTVIRDERGQTFCCYEHYMHRFETYNDYFEDWLH